MSRYLIDRIEGLANIEVVTRAQITGLEGRDGALEAVRWRVGATGEEVRREIRHLFLFIGADPNTDWLAGSDVVLDAKGFVLTGEDAGSDRHPLETTRRGVFAIGDVRAKSVKRVAAAVGEGAQVVAALQDFLGDTASLKRLNRDHWLAHRIRAIHSTSPIASVRSACCTLSDFSSIDLAVLRLSSFAITSPPLVRTTTRSPRRIGADGDTTMTSPSR